eukprot:TRINITY_DN2194_c0_g1_i1.p1 TRINITY_DN2194_c0_g1~~TRINITY_DN2194_c0_g1_i1.p1  ORF type:complete len:1764 (+),score=260.76 TRINITY_DN2194_c0_g1_i1:94-5292(+)
MSDSDTESSVCSSDSATVVEKDEREACGAFKWYAADGIDETNPDEVGHAGESMREIIPQDSMLFADQTTDERKRLRKLHKLTLKYTIENPLRHHVLRKALTFIKINQTVFTTKLRTLDRESRILGDGAFGITLQNWRELWSQVGSEFQDRCDAANNTKSMVFCSPWMDNEPLDPCQTTYHPKIVKLYQEITSEYRDDIFHLLNIDGSRTLETEELKAFLMPIPTDGSTVELFTPEIKDPWQLVERKRLLKLLKITMEEELSNRQEQSLNCRLTGDHLERMVFDLCSGDTMELEATQIGGKTWRKNQKLAITDVADKGSERGVKHEAGRLVFFISTGAAKNEHINYGCDRVTHEMIREHLSSCAKVLRAEKKHFTDAEIQAEANEMAQDVRDICESIVTEEVYEEFIVRLRYFFSGYNPENPECEEQGVMKYIARNKHNRRTKAKLEYTCGSLYSDIIEITKRRVTEQEFLEVYQQSTGIEGECPIWGNMNHMFRGLIPKKSFFVHCIKGRTPQTDGLSYVLEYIDHKKTQMKLQRHFIFYILFVLMYAVAMQVGTNINGAYYLSMSIDEAVGLEEVGDAADQFFPWTFHDIRNIDEYWDWLSQTLIPFGFGDDYMPGVYTTHHFSNKVVGAIKLTQYRAPSGSCDGRNEMVSNSLPEACFYHGDPRQATNWETWTEFSGSSVQNDKLLPTCIQASPDTFARSVKIGVTDTPGSRLASNVFRYILEEQLSVSATLVPVHSFNVQTEILNGNIDIVFSVWNSSTGEDLQSGVSATASPVPDPTPGLYISEKAASICPECVTSGLGGLAESTDIHQYFTNDGAAPPKVLMYAPDQSLDFSGWVDVQSVINSNSFDTALVANHIVEPTTDKTTHDGYIEAMTTKANLGEIFAFWSFDTDVLLTQLNSVKLSLPEGSEYSAIQSQTLHKSDFQQRFPDVFQLISQMTFSQTDSNSILEDACQWLKDNEGKWKRWIEQGVSQETLSNANYYPEKCYAPWDDSNEKSSYEFEAPFLKSAAERSAEEISNLYGPKVFPEGEFDGANFGHASSPFSVELQTLRMSAEAGDLNSEKLYKKLLPWVYQPCSQVGGEGLASYVGVVSSMMSRMKYSCDGYVMMFPISMTQSMALEEIEFLKNQNWIDIATRGLLLEFFVHNQNTRQLIRMQYMVEVSSAGAFVPSKRIHTFSLFQKNPENYTFWVIGFIVIALLFVFFLWATIKRFVRLWISQHHLLRYEAAYNHGKLFPLFDWRWPPTPRGFNLIIALFETLFSDVWMALELIIILLIFTTWSFRLWYFVYGISDSHILCLDVYPKDFETISDLTWIASGIDGVTVIFLSLKIFYFLQTDKDMNLIIRTLRRAGSLIFNLLVICLIILFGFIFSAWVVFGSLVASYRDIQHSFQGLFLMIMGEFDFQNLYAARPVFATLFFMLFYVVLIAVLFNLLVGVMSATFDEVSLEQFDEVTFLQRIAHDPTTAAWPKIGFFSGLRNQSWWTDIQFWGQRFMYMLTFWRSAQQGRMILSANRNPRIFWRKYRVIIEMLDGMNMKEVFEAVLVMHQLSRNLCDRLVPDENAEGLLEPKSVQDFISEEVESNRYHFIEHFLVLVPTNFMHSSISWQWKEILAHHKEWRTKTSKWAKFSRSLEEEYHTAFLEIREHVDSCITSARKLIGEQGGDANTLLEPAEEDDAVGGGAPAPGEIPDDDNSGDMDHAMASTVEATPVGPPGDLLTFAPPIHETPSAPDM